MKYIPKLFFMAVLLIGVSAFYGCGNDDDDYPKATIAIGMATVERPPQYDAPYFVLDNGKKMWVVQSLVPYQDLKAGERIFGNYSLLQPGEDGFNYNIRLNDYTMVPVQEVIDLNVENVDSIGNNSVQVRNMWPSVDYLNVRFMLNYPNPQRPILNLAFNEMIPLENDGYAHLELRYNNNGSQGRLVPGMVSFKLGKYGPSNTELKGLKVLVKTSDNGEKTYTFSYPLTNDEAPAFNPIDLSELK
ncbi:NigD-like protein [Phocaeicola sp.]